MIFKRFLTSFTLLRDFYSKDEGKVKNFLHRINITWLNFFHFSTGIHLIQPYIDVFSEWITFSIQTGLSELLKTRTRYNLSKFSMTILRFLYVVTNWWKNTGLENLVEIRRNFESSMRRPRDMNIYSTILWGDEILVYKKMNLESTQKFRKYHVWIFIYFLNWICSISLWRPSTDFHITSWWKVLSESSNLQKSRTFPDRPK